MATIIERNGRFLARVRRRGFSPVSQTFHRRSDAAAWGRQVEADMEGGRWLANNTTGAAPSLRQAIATYQRGAGSTLKGAKTYAYWLSEASLTLMASKAVNEVTSADIAGWRDAMSQTLKPGTVARKLGMLSGFFTWAQMDCGWIAANPVRQVRKPRVNDSRDRVVSPPEMEFIQRAAQRSKAKWLADVLIVLQTSAMRRSELWGLQATDIDFCSSTARLADTKNGDARDVPLCPVALAALRRLSERAQAAHSTKLVPVASPHAVSLAFRRTLVRARTLYKDACRAKHERPAAAFLSDLRLHDFRHHAVSEWASTGSLSLVELMAISGHKSPRMLARYTHLSPSSLAAKLATIRISIPA